jgi:hypothetical protein
MNGKLLKKDSFPTLWRIKSERIINDIFQEITIEEQKHTKRTRQTHYKKKYKAY